MTKEKFVQMQKQRDKAYVERLRAKREQADKADQPTKPTDRINFDSTIQQRVLSKFGVRLKVEKPNTDEKK